MRSGGGRLVPSFTPSHIPWVRGFDTVLKPVAVTHRTRFEPLPIQFKRMYLLLRACR